MKKSDQKSLVVVALSFLITSIGALVILGWLFDLPLLTSYKFIWTPMVMSTAVCTLLFGLSLLFSYFFNLNTSIPLQRFSGVFILLIASLALAETVFSWSFFIDLPELHRSYQVDAEHPGRMAPNTALAFIFASISLLFQSLNNAVFTKRARRCAQAVIFISSLGLLGYLFNLHYLYNWGQLKMSVPTAISLLCIGICLLFQINSEFMHSDEFQIKRIYLNIVFLLLTITIGSTLTVFLIASSRTEQIIKDKLAAISQDRMFFFDAALAARSERVLAASRNELITTSFKTLAREPANPKAFKALEKIANDLLSHGFSAAYFYYKSHQYLLHSGMLSSADSLSFEISAKYDAKLIWDGGYVLRNRLTIKDNQGAIIGYMMTEQRMLALDNLRKSLKNHLKSTDMLICGRAQEMFNCFPSITEEQPFSMPKFMGKQRLSISRALDLNESGVIENIDYRGNRVIASFGKIPNTHLGMVIKTDRVELYAPIKDQLIKSGIALLGLILLSLWLIRKRLMPLISVLEESKLNSEKAKQQFIVAAEGGLDAFLILESIRSAENLIVDFKCTYVNFVACRLFQLDKPTFITKSFFSSVPYFAETKFLNKFKYTIDTGNTVSEELKVDFSDLKIKWISYQFVKLGDGVAVTIRDITERKHIESALAEIERIQSAIVRSAAYSIIATDIHGTIISMNKASQNMLWYDENELVGKHTPEIIHDKDEVIQRASELTNELEREVRPGFEVFVVKTEENMNEEREWTYIRKDGSRFPVNLSVTQLKDHDNRVCGYMGVAYDITENKRNEEYIKHIALHDVLTGLPNRTLFTDRAGMAFEIAKREHNKVAIALLDLDHFKLVNDSLGHHIGDMLLQEVTRRLGVSLRPTDTVARMGGDEFAFVLPNITDISDVTLIFNKIINVLKPEVIASNHKLHVTASIGVCIFPNNGTDLSELLRNADTAMYRAKALGRNNFQLFNHEMEFQATKRLMLENELRDAIATESFELYYQPQFDLKTNIMTGVEALIRWQKDPNVHIAPPDFIPIAEESGLIVPLGNWIIKTACMQSKIINAHFKRPIRMAINISPRQFKQKNLSRVILDCIAEAQLDTEFFEIEITENVLMSDIENSETMLNQLSHAGVKIALDDFGTGYSSLSYLTKFPIDRIKIDQSFIKNVSVSRDSADLAKVIINLAKSLRIPSIAEGVETLEQLDFVKSAECDEVQGFYMGAPMKLEALLALFTACEA